MFLPWTIFSCGDRKSLPLMNIFPKVSYLSILPVKSFCWGSIISLWRKKEMITTTLFTGTATKFHRLMISIVKINNWENRSAKRNCLTKILKTCWILFRSMTSSFLKNLKLHFLFSSIMSQIVRKHPSPLRNLPYAQFSNLVFQQKKLPYIPTHL